MPLLTSTQWAFASDACGKAAAAVTEGANAAASEASNDDEPAALVYRSLEAEAEVAAAAAAAQEELALALAISLSMAEDGEIPRRETTTTKSAEVAAAEATTGGGGVHVHGARKATPASVTWTKGQPLDVYVPVPSQYTAVLLDVEATGGVVYVDEITQGCLSAFCVSHACDASKPPGVSPATAPTAHLATYVYTERPIPERLEEKIGILSASHPNSQMRGHAPFGGTGGFGDRVLALLRAQRAPIVLVGHRLLEYDLPLLLEEYERAGWLHREDQKQRSETLERQKQRRRLPPSQNRSS